MQTFFHFKLKSYLHIDSNYLHNLVCLSVPVCLFPFMTVLEEINLNTKDLNLSTSVGVLACV